MLQNPKFAGSIYRMKRALKARDLFDNVYAEVKPRHYFISMRGAPNASTQTLFLDLLHGLKEDP
jgi:hypothetical protein